MAHFFILNGQKLTLVVLIVLFAITTTCFSATEASPTKTETGDGHDSAEVSTEGHNTEQMAELREAEVNNLKFIYGIVIY